MYPFICSASLSPYVYNVYNKCRSFILNSPSDYLCSCIKDIKYRQFSLALQISAPLITKFIEMK